MDKDEVKRKLKEYSKKVSNHFKFNKLILYGSYATNSFHKDSDIDVAIVVEKNDLDFFSTEPLLWKLASEVDSRIEPIILEENNDPSGFLKYILKHGEIITVNLNAYTQ